MTSKLMMSVDDINSIISRLNLMTFLLTEYEYISSDSDSEISSEYIKLLVDMAKDCRDKLVPITSDILSVRSYLKKSLSD